MNGTVPVLLSNINRNDHPAMGSSGFEILHLRRRFAIQKFSIIEKTKAKSRKTGVAPLLLRHSA